MKKITKILLLSLVLILTFGAITASAYEAYDTYTYSIDGEPLQSPAAYTASLSLSSAAINLLRPEFGNTPLGVVTDIVTDKASNVYLADKGLITVDNSHSVTQKISPDGDMGAFSRARGRGEYIGTSIHGNSRSVEQKNAQGRHRVGRLTQKCQRLPIGRRKASRLCSNTVQIPFAVDISLRQRHRQRGGRGGLIVRGGLRDVVVCMGDLDRDARKRIGVLHDVLLTSPHGARGKRHGGRCRDTDRGNGFYPFRWDEWAE